jgi:hypothetical protein
MARAVPHRGLTEAATLRRGHGEPCAACAVEGAPRRQKVGRPPSEPLALRAEVVPPAASVPILSRYSFVPFTASRSLLSCSRVGGIPGVMTSCLPSIAATTPMSALAMRGTACPAQVGIVELAREALGHGRADGIGTLEVVGESGVNNSADGVCNDSARLRSVASIRINHEPSSFFPLDRGRGTVECGVAAPASTARSWACTSTPRLIRRAVCPNTTPGPWWRPLIVDAGSPPPVKHREQGDGLRLPLRMESVGASLWPLRLRPSVNPEGTREEQPRHWGELRTPRL